jgi:hypothetical protein
MTPSQIAYRAAAIIAESGHCKYALWDDQGRCCFNGAVARAIAPGDSRFASRAGFYAFLEDGGDACFRVIAAEADSILMEQGWEAGPIRYNNLPGTSGEDVILLLKEAGRRLEEEGQ